MPGSSELVERHRRACDGFAAIAHQVARDQWTVSTPCPDWTARDLVEHVIGFHEFLLLRPLGIRAQRPRDDPAARWDATATALFGALASEGAVDRATELPGGGTSTPATMLGALTTDVLVHTWDLARATQLEPNLDDTLCRAALAAARQNGINRDGVMIGPEHAVDDRADAATKLAAFYGRDPRWSPPR